MATHTLKVRRNDSELKVEVEDSLNKNGLVGFHYNYRFLLKQLKNKKWGAWVYRPGEATSFASLADTPGKDLAVVAFEKIEKDYFSRIKNK